jgi:transcriptional regulator with XRE-family HTH domain
MRPSEEKTNVARLRVLLDKFEAQFGKGFDQKEFAELIGCKVQKLQNIETGRTRLDELLARSIAEETGASMKSLLNEAAPLIAQDGRKYTAKIFAEVQAQKKYSARQVNETNVKTDALEFLRTIVNILLRANRKGNYHLVAYRIDKALDELRDVFGQAWDFKSFEQLLTYLLKVFPKVPGLRILGQFHWKDEQNFRKELARVDRALRDRPTTSKSKSKRPLKRRRR